MNLAQLQRDYERVAASIQWLRAHHREQPRLEQMAAAAGLSPSHYQRLFSRWAGISPKRFLQYLTLEYARDSIRDSASILDASLQTGLSGPGRLHDLFVTLEAISPGEFKRKGAGLVIEYAEIPTPFGAAAIGFTARGVCHLSFLPVGSDAEAAVSAAWPHVPLSLNRTRAEHLGARIFCRAGMAAPVSAWVVGSNFQVQVWRALLELPEGHLWSYGELARRVGRPRAARAAGTAMAVNPLAYLIPCHRVLRQDGQVGEYHWGADRKALMVAREAARRHRGRP